MIEMTLHAVTVRCETLTQALVLLDSWAEMGRITLPPAPAAKPSEVEDLGAAAKRVTATLERLGEAGIRLPSVPPPAKPSPRKAPGKAPGTATERPPRERRCRKCQRTFADKTCAKDCPTCRPSYPKKDPTAKAAVPAAPAKTSVHAKTPAPPRPSAPKRTPDVAAAKGLLGRAQIRPSEPVKACSACGDKTRLSELDGKDRCRDCRPIGEPA